MHSLIICKCSHLHGAKRVRIRGYSGPHFSRIFPHSDWIRGDTGPHFSRIFQHSDWTYSVRMRENPGKMRTRITPNTDSFYAAKRLINIKLGDLYGILPEFGIQRAQYSSYLEIQKYKCYKLLISWNFLTSIISYVVLLFTFRYHVNIPFISWFLTSFQYKGWLEIQK